MAKKKSDIQIVVNDVNNSNFGKSLSILRDSNFDKYTQVINQEDVLRNIFTRSKSKISQKEAFLQNLVNLLQSLTIRGFHTFEIVQYIAGMLSNLKNGSDEDTKEILKSSIQIFHCNYEKILSPKNYQDVKDILFNHTDERDIGRGVYIDYSNSGINFFDEIAANNDYKRNIKILGLFGTGIDETQEIEEKKRIFQKQFKESKVNTNPKNPSKMNPAFSSILVTNPDFRIGTRNSLELSTFFNTINNIELSRSYPYFNATFVLPTISRKDKKLAFKSSTINQFLFGSLRKKATKNYDNLSGDPVVNPNTGKPREDVIQTNLALFTTPQTLVNLNENIGHAINNPSTLRLTSVNDSTKPFMTIKSFTINTAPTKGLMSYKTGKLSITIHDRTRIADIAPFVKPDLYGSFGSEIILEYGWSNPDENAPKENPLGAFIGNSKVVEKYSIVNSSMNIETNGIVNVELSLSMKGANEFKNTQVSAYSKDRVEKGELRGIIQEINEARESLGLKDRLSSLSHLSSNEDTIISEKSRIDNSSKSYIREIFDNYNFLFSISDISSEYILTASSTTGASFSVSQPGQSLHGGPPDPQKKQYTALTDEQFNILASMFAKNISKDSSKKLFIIPVNETITSVKGARSQIQIIIEGFKYLIERLKNIVEEDNLEEELERQFLTNIIGGIKYIDPFFPHDALEKINNVGEYISFGTVVNSLICSHIVSTKQYDEVQTIFYNANEDAGAMAGKNLAGLLINKKLLTELFEDLLLGRKIITLESMISQILLKLVQTSDNISLGISDLYEERKNFSDSIKLKNPDPKKFSKLKNTKLFEIYYPGETPTADALNDIKFKIPVINMTFDCITSEKDINKSILRISIFDRNDSPFNQTSQIMDKIYSSDFLSSIKVIRDSKLKFESGELSRRKYKEKIKSQIDLLINKGILKKDTSGNYIVNPQLGVGIKKKSKIKEIYKEIFPSLTFGSQNTAIISANVSSINDNKLDTLFITRPDRNNLNEFNSRVLADLPLNIRPSQASIELIGCPWINFSQFIYLDFGTGTTIDNKYAVTGITHNFSPGKFTTNLTLSYGDNFGQFDAGTDVVSYALKEVAGLSSKSKRTIADTDSKEKNNISITIDRKYLVNLQNFYRPNLSLPAPTHFNHNVDNPFLQGIKDYGYIDPIERRGTAIKNKAFLTFSFKNNYIDKIFKSYFGLPTSNQYRKNVDIVNYTNSSFLETAKIKTSISVTDVIDFFPYQFNDINKPYPSSALYEKIKNFQILVENNSNLDITYKDIESNIFNNKRSSIDYSKFNKITLINLYKEYKNQFTDVEKIEFKKEIEKRIRLFKNLLFTETKKGGSAEFLNNFIFLEIKIKSNNEYYTIFVNFLGDSLEREEYNDFFGHSFLNVSFITDLKNTFACNDKSLSLKHSKISNNITCTFKAADKFTAYITKKYNDGLAQNMNNLTGAELDHDFKVGISLVENENLNVNLSQIQDIANNTIEHVHIRNQRNQYVVLKQTPSTTPSTTIYTVTIYNVLKLFEECLTNDINQQRSILDSQKAILDQTSTRAILPIRPSDKDEIKQKQKSSKNKTYQLPILQSSLEEISPVILNIGELSGDVDSVAKQIKEIPLLYSMTDLLENAEIDNEYLTYSTIIKPCIRKAKSVGKLDDIRLISDIGYLRRYPIQPRLFNIIEQAIIFTNKKLNADGIKQTIKGVITSAGSEPFYSYYNAQKANPSLPDRDKKTIRHDLGFALDVSLYYGPGYNNIIKLTEITGNFKDTLNYTQDMSVPNIQNYVVYTFLSIAKNLGITAIGAHHEYSDGAAFHLDIAKSNLQINEGKYNELVSKLIVQKDLVSMKYWGKGGKSAFTPGWLKNIFNGHTANSNE